VGAELQAPQPQAKRRPVKRVLRRFRDSEKGQALVEFTMVLPMFLLLLFALVDFGRGFYTWIVVTNAAREGARVAAVQGDQAAIQSRIDASYCSNAPDDCSLDHSKLTWTNSGTANIQGERGDPVVIELSYDFEFVTPMGAIMEFLSAGNITAPDITAHSSMRLE
jgi:Flp pilus assembly protein TadG